MVVNCGSQYLFNQYPYSGLTLAVHLFLPGPTGCGKENPEEHAKSIPGAFSLLIGDTGCFGLAAAGHPDCQVPADVLVYPVQQLSGSGVPQPCQ
jgi:hypothetical protein